MIWSAYLTSDIMIPREPSPILGSVCMDHIQPVLLLLLLLLSLVWSQPTRPNYVFTSKKKHKLKGGCSKGLKESPSKTFVVASICRSVALRPFPCQVQAGGREVEGSGVLSTPLLNEYEYTILLRNALGFGIKQPNLQNAASAETFVVIIPSYIDQDDERQKGTGVCTFKIHTWIRLPFVCKESISVLRGGGLSSRKGG